MIPRSMCPPLNDVSITIRQRIVPTMQSFANLLFLKLGCWGYTSLHIALFLSLVFSLFRVRAYLLSEII